MTKYNKTSKMQYDADAIIRAGIDEHIAQVYARVARYAFLCKVFGYDEKSLKKEVRERANLMHVVIPNAQLQHDAAAAVVAARSVAIIDLIKQGVAAGDNAESIIAAVAAECQKRRFSYKVLFEKKSNGNGNGNGNNEKTRLEKFAESLSLDDIKNLRGLLTAREKFIKDFEKQRAAERKAIEKQARERAAEQVRNERAAKKAQARERNAEKQARERAEKKLQLEKQRNAEKQAAADKKLIESREKIDSAYNTQLAQAEKMRLEYISAKSAAVAAFALRAESKKQRNAAKKAIKAARAVRERYAEKMQQLANKYNKKQQLAQALRRAA